MSIKNSEDSAKTPEDLQQLQEQQKKMRFIRVFVSSTFKDMHTDRDMLVKKAFPQLRKLCESRAVIWTDVDLRWGITPEQTNEGQVLPLCFAEIERCRPYFLCLLGERYGWVPDSISSELLDKEPWIKKHREHSVTALEIFHGVLNNPEMAERALFFFRDPAYIKEFEPAIRSDFECESHASRDKLIQLKHRILETYKNGKLKYPPVENYANPDALADAVIAIFTKIIDEVYPKDEIPDPMDQEANRHEEYARSMRDFYIGRSDDFDVLDRHMEREGLPLVLTGEPGCGKTALLANWAQRWRKAHPEDLIIEHYIGSSASSTNWRQLVYRIMGHRRPQLQEGQREDFTSRQLRKALGDYLDEIGNEAEATGRRFVLLIDDLHSLVDREGARDLAWFPDRFHPRIRVFLSTRTGRSLDVVSERRWAITPLDPLGVRHRKDIIRAFLKRWGKVLTPMLVNRTTGHSKMGNPRFLVTLIEELRVFGIHEELETRLSNYLAADSFEELISMIISRWENDYESDHSGLVRDAMGLLATSRFGLTENVLRECLGSGDSMLPQAVWAPLHLAAEPFLTLRSGRICFTHVEIADAVRKRYLVSEAERRQFAGQLSRALADREWVTPEEDFTGRNIHEEFLELPVQLLHSGDFEELNRLLAKVELLEIMWNFDRFEVKTLWTALEANSDGITIPETYRDVIAEPEQYPRQVLIVLSLLSDLGHVEEAISLCERLIKLLRGASHDSLQHCLGRLGTLLWRQGDLDRALVFYSEQEGVCRETENLSGLQEVLGNKANVLHARGDFKGSLKLHLEEEEICRRIDDLNALQACCGNMSIVLRDIGDQDGAMRYAKEQERIGRENDNPEAVAKGLCNQAQLYTDKNLLDQAMALSERADKIYERIGSKSGRVTSLTMHGMILQVRGVRTGALSRYEKAETIARDIGDRLQLQTILGSQGILLHNLGRLDDALAKFQEQEQLCRYMGTSRGLQISLGSQAMIMKAKGNLRLAMDLVTEAEDVCRTLDDEGNLQAVLKTRAELAQEMQDTKTALALQQEREQICEKIGRNDLVLETINHQAQIMFQLEKLEEVLSLHQRQEQICRENEFLDKVPTYLICQAFALRGLKRHEEAIQTLVKAEHMLGQLGDWQQLSQCLNVQYQVFTEIDNDPKAVELLQKQEDICREHNIVYGLAESLANQAERAASHQGDIERARDLITKALKLAEENKLYDLRKRMQPVVELVCG